MEATFIPAIFESGKLRPLAPLDLKEQELVELAIVRAESTEDADDQGYLPWIAAEADDQVTLEQVQRALAKLPGSLEEDFSAEREDRF